MAPKGKKKGKKYSCPLCAGMDNQFMVPCKQCSRIFHTRCIDNTLIDESNGSFVCEDCFEMLRRDKSKGNELSSKTNIAVDNSKQSQQGKSDQSHIKSRVESDSVNPNQSRSRVVREPEVNKTTINVDDNRTNTDLASKYSERSSARRNHQLELARLEELEELRLQNVTERKIFIEHKYQLMMEDVGSSKRSTDRSSFTRSWVRQQQDAVRTVKINPKPDELPSSALYQNEPKVPESRGDQLFEGFPYTGFRSNSLDIVNPRLVNDSRRYFLKEIDQIQLDDDSHRKFNEIGLSNNKSVPATSNSQRIFKRPPECPKHDAKQHMFQKEVSSNNPECLAKYGYENPAKVNLQRQSIFNYSELNKRMDAKGQNVKQSTPKFIEEPDEENLKQQYHGGGSDQEHQNHQTTFDIPKQSNDHSQENRPNPEREFIKFMEDHMRKYIAENTRQNSIDGMNRNFESSVQQPVIQPQLKVVRTSGPNVDKEPRVQVKRIYSSPERENDQYDDIRQLQYPVNMNHQRNSNPSTRNSPMDSSTIKMEDYFKNEVVLTQNHIAARQVVDRKLSKFEGNPIEWPAWFQKILNTTSMCGLNNGENLERLEKCLDGKARDAVRSQLSYPQSVPWIMSTLKTLFGRPEVIIKLLIKKIKDIQPVKPDRIESLIEFAFEVFNISGTIELLAEQNKNFMMDPMLIEKTVSKLPVDEKKEWARYQIGIPNVTLKTLADWLYEKANVLSTVATPIFMKSKDKQSDNKKANDKKSNKSDEYGEKELARINVHTNSNSKQQSDDSSDNSKSVKSPPKPSTCLVCNKGCGKLENCQNFKSLSVDLRWKAIIEHKLCYKCLKKHKFPCKATNGCDQIGCRYKQKHHSLLHNNERHSVARNQSQNDVNGNNVLAISSNIHNDINRSTLLRILPVVLHHQGKRFITFAFIDEGSTTTMMEQAVANELGLSGSPEMLCLIWTKNIHRKEKAERVTLQISGSNSPRKYSLKGIRTVGSLELPTQSLNRDELVKKYPFLREADFASYENARPTILIGSDHPKLGIQLRYIEGPDDNSPVATKTRLGWTIHGPTDSYSANQYVNVHQYEICPDHNECDSDMHQQIKEYFSIENFGVQVNNKFNGESQEDKRVMELLDKNTRKVNGKYETGLLWKEDEFEVPDSYPMAMRRLICLEKQGAKVVEAVGAKIDDYLAKNYARKLSPDEVKVDTPVWYLPPFGVVHPKKPEKLRMVFDAAAKVKNVSLNSFLLKGPDLYTSLVDILRRFRERCIAIGGDIREMYHQIKVMQADQNFQRFLFRHGDSQREPDVYVMKVMIFGATCAPFIAQHIKNQNASEFKESHPEAVKSIIENHYVDDMMDGEHSEEAAIKLLQDVQMIHAQGGFEIRNFLSNSPSVLKAMEAEEENNSKSILLNSETNIERVLGMWWNTKTDTFTFSLKYTPINEDILNGRKLPTKRELLRILMTIFDPLGLLSNYLIQLKIIIQDIWRSDITWDQQISSDNLVKSWKQWLEILPQVENVQISRLLSTKLSPGSPMSIQLHIFVDASEYAFAAVAYVRVEDNNGIDCALLGSKAKVAPLKYLSIPRKELMAAVLGSRLGVSISNAQRLKFNRKIIWSDSETVLSWLKSSHRKYSQFVAHRVGEILDATDVNEWRWIPTKQNVADEATKWAKPITFDSNNRWFSGPEFIRQDEDHWPKKVNIKADVEEEMKAHFVHSSLVIPQSIDPARFSNWNRMVRALAYSIRCLRMFNGNTKRGSPLSQEELIKAENLIFRQAQFESYPSEMVTLERNKSLPVEKRKFIEKPSPLFDGSPYLDADGVLRMKGRIDGARELSMDTKRPIVLPNDSRITQLLIQHYHSKFYHQYHETVINEIRQRFYIPRLRTTLKKVKRNCQMCKVKKAHIMEPQMADLPPARLSVGFRPFSFVGIDFFGPMKVLIGRREEKRWGVLFTCLTIRAIHIEIASSLDTNSCIMCINNFIAEKGQVIEFHSDCGTNFVGANNELEEELQKIDKDRLETEFTSRYLKWSFNPPSAPHMGGSWERLIGIVKVGIEEVMQMTRIPKEEVLRNVLKEIQNVVNSRPLTFIPLEVEEDEALTPNHFLLGCSNGLKPPCRLELDGVYLRQSWKEAQRLTEMFWKRFAKEYLPTLARRTKWFKQVQPIKEDDLVLVIDGNNPRNTYPKATVIDTKIGSNGQVRRAKVRYVTEAKIDSKGQICRIRKNSVWRPAHKLAVLDVVGPVGLAALPEPVFDIERSDTNKIQVASKSGSAQGNRGTGGSVDATKFESDIGARDESQSLDKYTTS